VCCQQIIVIVAVFGVGIAAKLPEAFFSVITADEVDGPVITINTHINNT
jgi:hypothetical protein